MKRCLLTFALVLTLAQAGAQALKVEFLTPRIVHIVKGQPTKTLVVTAQPEQA